MNEAMIFSAVFTLGMTSRMWWSSMTWGMTWERLKMYLQSILMLCNWQFSTWMRLTFQDHTVVTAHHTLTPNHDFLKYINRTFIFITYTEITSLYHVCINGINGHVQTESGNLRVHAHWRGVPRGR